jgi:hypothetical protein
MLWTFPSRAHPPIVDVVKWTLAAARIAWASDRVIQSDPDGIDQSPPAVGSGVGVELFVEGELDGGVSLAGASVSLLFDDDPSVPAFDPPVDDLVAARRSFFAQPDPLKWIAGAANALRTGPDPHNGQVVGGSAWTPWMTSNRRPHAAQS